MKVKMFYENLVNAAVFVGQFRGLGIYRAKLGIGSRWFSIPRSVLFGPSALRNLTAGVRPLVLAPSLFSITVAMATAIDST